MKNQKIKTVVMCLIVIFMMNTISINGEEIVLLDIDYNIYSEKIIKVDVPFTVSCQKLIINTSYVVISSHDNDDQDVIFKTSQTTYNFEISFGLDSDLEFKLLLFVYNGTIPLSNELTFLDAVNVQQQESPFVWMLQIFELMLIISLVGFIGLSLIILIEWFRSDKSEEENEIDE